MKKLLPLAILLLACQAGWAGNLKPAAAPKGKAAVNKTDATDSPYVLKKQSYFSGTPNDHNPFWPIGWVKVEDDSADSSQAPYVPKATDFLVTSILLNEPPLAVINGRDMAEGEVAALDVNGQPVVVQLMAVQDGRVILRWQNQEIIVPLHRDEDLSETDGAQQSQ